MLPVDLDEFQRLHAAGFNVIPVTRTLQLDRETPVSLFDRFGERGLYLLESAASAEGTGRFSFFGVDRRWRVSTTNGRVVGEGVSVDDPTGDPLEELRRILSRYRTAPSEGLPDFFGGAVGYVSYDYVRRIERLAPTKSGPDWPEIDFQFAELVVICDHVTHATTLVALAVIEDAFEDAYDAARRRLEEAEDLLARPLHLDEKTEAMVTHSPNQRSTYDTRATAATLSNFTLPQYADVVRRAQEYIHQGDIFQVVPSQQFAQPTSVDPFTLYRILRGLNPSPYMYLLRSAGATLVGASPEMLVRVHEGTVRTRPIAGTRPRGASDDADLALERDLLSDEKEIAEHVMLVDLGRNDVGRVATPGTVRVVRLAHIERFSHLMHLVSEVEGELRDGLDAFDAFRAVFPAGTLSGAPKVRAMEIIDEFEPVPRGPYGGAVGYFSLSGSADFAITIRTVSIKDGVAYVQAGGGVVADSIGANEYQECVNKASAPLLALALASNGTA